MSEYKLRKLLNTIKNNWRVAVVVTVMMTISGYIFSAYGLKKQFVAYGELYIESLDDEPHSGKAEKAAMLFESPRMYDAINNNLKIKFSYAELSKMITYEQKSDTQIISATFCCQSGSDAYRLAEISMNLTQQVLDDFGANASVRITVPPAEPTEPVFPDDRIFTIAGAIIGASLSIAGIIFIWRLDNTITHADNIKEEYGLTVLGELMDFDKEIDYLGR